MKTKKATIVAMSALAAQVAITDMKAEFGNNYIPMDDGTYTYDPFDGIFA